MLDLESQNPRDDSQHHASYSSIYKREFGNHLMIHNYYLVVFIVGFH